jgi:hypothetical protein
MKILPKLYGLRFNAAKISLLNQQVPFLDFFIQEEFENAKRDLILKKEFLEKTKREHACDSSVNCVENPQRCNCNACKNKIALHSFEISNRRLKSLNKRYFKFDIDRCAENMIKPIVVEIVATNRNIWGSEFLGSIPIKLDQFYKVIK